MSFRTLCSMKLVFTMALSGKEAQMSFADGDLLIFCTPAVCWRKQCTLGNPTHFLFAALADAHVLYRLIKQIRCSLISCVWVFFKHVFETVLEMFSFKLHLSNLRNFTPFSSYIFPCKIYSCATGFLGCYFIIHVLKSFDCQNLRTAQCSVCL